jgi:hypothetical protein
MPEDIKPPVPAVGAPAAKPVAPEKLSPEALVAKIRAELKLAERQADTSANFGPGKSGKRLWTIPSFPREWRMTDLKTVNKNGKRIFVQGKKYELTFDEIEDLASRFATRVRFEVKARGGTEGGVTLQSSGHLF